MGQVNRPSQFQGLENNFLGLGRTYNLTKAINGGIDFGISTQTGGNLGSAYYGNVNGQWANVTAPAAPNTTFTVTHNLGRIPSAYFYNTDRAAIVFGLPGTFGTWTTTSIFLQSSVGSAVLRIFLF